MNEREILDQLITEKKITEEDIAGASDRALTPGTKEIIDMLHSRFCNLNHASSECGWYDEYSLAAEGRPEEWKGPSHLAWVRLFNDFLASTKLIKLVPESITEESTGSSDGSPLPG